MNANEIIIKPVLTEKSSLLREAKQKTYVFKVAKNANKPEIMNAISSMFSVKPVSCTILNVKGKKKANVLYRGSVKRGHGTTASWKKAYVTLPKGKTIAELEA